MGTVDTIYCYTGTGNTLASAKVLSRELNMRVVLITDDLEKQSVVGERCLIMYPVYAYGMPKTVRRFIAAAAFDVKYMAVIATYGSSSGGAFAETIRLLRTKKQKVDLSVGIRAVENYVHIFGFRSDRKIAKTNERQTAITQRVADMIKRGQKNRRLLFRPFSAGISSMFRAAIGFFERKYRVNGDCTSCGMCEKICPARAIKMADGRPVFVPKQCDHCQACMQLCPARAIEFGRIKKNGKRYRHADVTPDELIKR